MVKTGESKYIEKKSYLSRFVHEQELAFRESEGHLETEFGSEAEWFRCMREDFPKFIPFLTRKSGLEFRGRILEIGAGAAWFSAELSKLPKVVEIVAVDFSPKLLREKAPKVFEMLKANAAKITRSPGDFHKLDFPNNHFDFIVASAVLHHAVNMVQVLKEVRRLLKPGGQFVAIREPVWPLVKLKSRSKTQSKLVAAGVNEHFYTMAEYEDFFDQAGLSLRAIPVNLSSGMKFYFDKMVNGLTHARYAFVAVKPAKS
jgi:SAM-dependent methyltransferase